MATRIFIAFSFLLLLLSGCNLLDTENNKETTSAKVLNDPPFRSLSDSIKDSPKDAALYIKRAERLLQAKHTRLAVMDYEKAWKLQPDEMTTLYYASGLFITGKEMDAINILKDGVKKFPDNTEFRRRLSEAYMQTGDPQEALKQYNHIIAQDPENFEAWYQRGVILATMRDTAKAIEAMERSYSIQPLQLSGISLANLYAETKNPKTIALCDELISRDPEGQATDPIFLKGIYYSNTGQPALALQEFETCIKNDWKFTEAYIEKGIVFFEQKQFDQALETFRLAAQVSNTYADAYFWIGRAQEARGKPEEAKENYYKALALDKNFHEAKVALRRLGE